MVAGHDHHVEIGGDVEHPVELRQRIMEVGYQEQSHRSMPTLLEVEPRNQLLWHNGASANGPCCRGPQRKLHEPPRRGARVVEWDGLENRCTGNRTVGSNPTLSAI